METVGEPARMGSAPRGVRTQPGLFGHGLSHRPVPSASRPGHAAQGLQVGASLRSPGKPPLRRVHRPRGAGGGGSAGRTRAGRRWRPAAWCQRGPRASLTRGTGGRCPERASGPPGQGCSGRTAPRFGSLTRGWARVRGRARRAAPVLEVRGSAVDASAPGPGRPGGAREGTRSPGRPARRGQES